MLNIQERDINWFAFRNRQERATDRFSENFRVPNFVIPRVRELDLRWRKPWTV